MFITAESRPRPFRTVPAETAFSRGERERKTNAREWRYGTHGSLSVNLDKGIWFEHELNGGGGCIDLILQEVPEARENGGMAHWLREQGL